MPNLFKNKYTKCKPEDLQKAFKSLYLPNKSGGYMVIALAENETKDDTNSFDDFNVKKIFIVFFKPGRKFVCNFPSHQTDISQFNLILKYY